MWRESIKKFSKKRKVISISQDCAFEEEPYLYEDRENKAPKSQAMRRCVVSRRVAPKEHLIRFVAAPDGTVVPDLRCRLPGRGIWITAQRFVVDQAVSGGVFSRGLRTGVKVSAHLGQEVDSCLEKRALHALAFAHKAGVCRLGYNQVEEALRSGKVAGLFAAMEASENQWNTLKHLATSLYKEREEAKIHIFQGFSTDH